MSRIVVEGEPVSRRTTFVQNAKCVAREEAFGTELLILAQKLGLREGLPAEEALHSATGFVSHMLANQSLRVKVSERKDLPPGWIQRCAKNWVRNYLRDQQRLYAREHLAAEPQQFERNAASVNSNLTLSPEAQIIRKELMERITAVAASLTEQQRQLLVRRFLLGHSSEDIARAMGRTPDAVRQSLVTLRRRVRILCVDGGLTSDEANSYLSLLTILTSSSMRVSRGEHDE